MRRGTAPRIHIRAICLVGLFVSVACSSPSGAGDGSDGSRIGDRAPAFSLDRAGGGRVASADYEGRPILLYFSMGPG